LSELAAQDRKVTLLGSVKGGSSSSSLRKSKQQKSREHEASILEFYQEYFGRNEIYQDDKWTMFRAMGGRKLSILSALRAFPTAMKRYKQHKIGFGKLSLTDTERLMMGGVLLFDKAGVLRFALYEQFGTEMDMDVLAAAIQETRRMGRRRRTTM